MTSNLLTISKANESRYLRLVDKRVFDVNKKNHKSVIVEVSDDRVFFEF